MSEDTPYLQTYQKRASEKSFGDNEIHKFSEEQGGNVLRGAISGGVQQESVIRGEYSSSGYQYTDQPFAQIYVRENKQQTSNISQVKVEGNGASSIKYVNPSSIIRKVIHYENPRKYVDYQSSLGYNSQSINYNSQYQCQQCTSACTVHNKANCTCNCSCAGVQLSLNPNYRFKVTREIDLKQSQFDSSNKEYELLLQKVQNLESLHNQEIIKLKDEFNIERSKQEKEITRHNLDLIKTLYVEQQEIAKPQKQQQQEVMVKEEKHIEVERKITEIETQKKVISSLEEKISTIKEKKKTLSVENKQLKTELFEKNLQIKQLEFQLTQKQEAISTTHVQKETYSGHSELEGQNQFLIQELGRITEEYEQLKKSSKIVEKLVYVPSVQNVTTVKEVPPYIEEKIIYVQDTDQLEAYQKIISQLQADIVSLNEEKQKLIMQQAEEKAQMYERINQITKVQKSESASIIKEVVVQKVIDRTEIQLKEQEYQECYKNLSAQLLKVAELEQIISNLQIEIQKLTRNYKLVKLPNNYRIEESVSMESKSISQSANYYRASQNESNIQHGVQYHNLSSNYQILSSPQKFEYQTFATLKKTGANYQQAELSNTQQEQQVERHEQSEEENN